MGSNIMKGALTMNLESIGQFISSYGFPILCCGAMFWYIVKVMKEFSTSVKATMDTLAASINKNTEATTKLVTTVELLVKLNDKDSDG